MPVVEQDPTERSFCSDPYPFYESLRALGGFVFWQDYDMPVATSHAAVNQVLRHKNMGRAVPPSLAPPPRDDLRTWSALEAHSLLEIEPPDHTRIRREASAAFAGPQMAAIALKISMYADQLIDRFDDGPFDLIEAYAKPLAALSITEFLGVAPEHATQLQTWSNRMVAMYQARRDARIEAEAEGASEAFVAFIRKEIDARRRSPRRDFLSQLVEAHAAERLSENELISTAILLLNAGHEATAHTLGNAVPLLLEFPGRAEALAPESIGGTVEECLRYKPPLHLFARYVYEDTEIDGSSFSKNQKIGCLLASGCRDDATWPDGNLFDPFRTRRPHTAFGAGLHSCVGAALARLELKIALPVLFARCPKLALVEKPEVADLYHFHGYERLMVTLR